MNTYNGNGDSVSISSEAIATNLWTNFMDGAAGDEVITLDEITAFRDKMIELAQNILRDTLNDLNIKSSERLKIDINPYNNEFIVTSATDEKNEAMAAVLQENDQFRNAYCAASGASTLLAAAEAAIPFRNAYNSDPKAAVAKYGWLFDKEWDFNMYFEDGRIDYSMT
jgi:hypothetical protein